MMQLKVIASVFIRSGTIALFCIVIVCTCGKSPIATGQADKTIDVSADPLQDMLEADTSVIIKLNKGAFTIKFVADYTLAGVVVCKQRFSHGWDGNIAPYDLTFCWGKLTEEYVRKQVSFSHSGRWYHYRYAEDCPVSNQYIIEHTSNNHIIPASENIRLAIRVIKTNTPVMLQGYLVDINGTYKNNPYWWNTSRVRTDTGAHSCEVFYVTSVQIGKDLYE
jgi:hypothetical protein